MLIPILQPAVIDVADWSDDPEFPRYPEGARDKAALFPPEPLPFDFLKPGRRYLFKLSDKKYPEQFWAETIAYIAGCQLGVQVPPAYIAYHSTRGTCGALIEWFFVDEEQTFDSGGNRLQKLLPNYDRQKGTHHNFQLVQRACMSAVKNGLHGDWLLYWSKAFVFDALIGNTDRHQDNWGFLTWMEGETARESLAPLFDNGTSLGMEKGLQQVGIWDDNQHEAYVNKGYHHIRWQRNDEKRAQHFALVDDFFRKHAHLKPSSKAMLEQFSLELFQQRLTELTKLDLPVRLTNERLSFILKLTRLRYRRLCAILS